MSNGGLLPKGIKGGVIGESVILFKGKKFITLNYKNS